MPNPSTTFRTLHGVKLVRADHVILHRNALSERLPVIPIDNRLYTTIDAAIHWCQRQTNPAHARTRVMLEKAKGALT
jgi:hypothetical protein